MSDKDLLIAASVVASLAITLTMWLVVAIFLHVGMWTTAFVSVVVAIPYGLILLTNLRDYSMNGSSRSEDSSGGTTSKRDRS
jgi:hypothetical protein